MVEEHQEGALGVWACFIGMKGTSDGMNKLKCLWESEILEDVEGS